MPIYEFCCKKCNLQYEELTKHDPSEKYPDIKCPDCGSKKKVKYVSVGQVKFNQPVGTDCWTSDGTGHDYRYKYTMDLRRGDRAAAEAASKVGPKPYKDIDDISSGEHFGPVK